MPSPAVPRSLSDHINLSKTHQSPSHVPSSKASRKSISFKRSSDLTEERLEEFNRSVNQNLDDGDDDDDDDKKGSLINSLSGNSPYCEGPTDSSLVLNRQRLLESSPERDSNGTSNSSKSRSSFKLKTLELSSWLVSFSKQKKSMEARRMRPGQTRPSSSSSSFSSSSYSPSSTPSSLRARETRKPPLKDLDLEGKVVSSSMTKDNNCSSVKKKPLRERYSELPPPPSSPSLAPSLPQESPQAEPELLPKPQKLAQTWLQVTQQPPTPHEAWLQAPSPPPTPEHKSPPPQRPPEQTSAPNGITGNRETSNTTPNEGYFWANNYRPEALEDFICHRNIALDLWNLARAENCDHSTWDHFIFEGPPGVGKRTMVWALLREAFGAERIQTREESKQFVLTGEAIKSIEVKVKKSLQHIEVNLSEAKGYEKNVTIALIQETIGTSSSTETSRCNKDNCRVIILYEADKLSTDALLYVKWQLERHKWCSKVFFCCSNASKLQPIMSICTVVKLLPPSNEEIVEVLEFIAKQEGIELPHQLAEKIADKSKNNLRQAIRSFEATSQAAAGSPMKEDQAILTGWEDDIANIAKNIIEEQSPKQLYNIRGKLQNLIEYNVSPMFMFDQLVDELKKHSDEKFRTKIDILYKEYKKPLGQSNNAMKMNLHHFLRIEEFIAKFMSCYKASIMKKGI